jgi:hypothetical protein
MSSRYYYPQLEERLSQLAGIQGRIKELEKQKEEVERELKGATDSFENSEVCFNIIKDFHLEKDDNHVVPITAVKMVKSVFEYTKSISYNKPKTENLMKQLGLSICETYSSELRLSELAFLDFNDSGQHMKSTVIHIDGKWKTFFHIFTGNKSEGEILSEGSRFSHKLSEFEQKSCYVYRDRGSYTKTYKSDAFILVFEYRKSTNITIFKAIPIKSLTPVLPGISVDVVDTQQFRGGGGRA